MPLFYRFGLLLVLLALFGCGSDDTPFFFSTTRIWGGPVTLSGDQDASGAQSVMDDQGNALVAWGSDSMLYAKKYVVAGGWDLVATRLDNSVLRAGSLKIDMNGNGDGVAVWRVEEMEGDFFYARRFGMTTDWDANFQRLCNNSYDGQAPDASINTGGSIMTVFSKYTANDVYARGYTTGSGWDVAPTIVDSMPGYSNWPRVALDDNGNGIAVWDQYDGTNTNLYARFYSAVTGWDGTVIMLDDPAVAGNVSDPCVALNAAGDGVAFWEQQNGASYEIYARTFHAGPTPGWDTVIFPVLSSTTGMFGVRGAIAKDGRIIITWIVSNGTRYQLYARSYSPADGWDAVPTLVSEPSLDLNVEAAYSAFDGDGNGLVVWSQDRETEPAIYSREYNARTGWGSKITKVYEYPEGFGGLVTSLSMTPAGKALITLNYFDMPDYNSGKVMAIFSR